MNDEKIYRKLGVPDILLNFFVGLGGESSDHGVLNRGLNLLVASAEVWSKYEDAVLSIKIRVIKGQENDIMVELKLCE